MVQLRSPRMEKEEAQIFEYLTRVAEALKGELDRVVIIGGFSSFLYHYWKKKGAPLFSFDTDIVVLGGNYKLREKIESSGFKEIPARSRGRSCGKFENEKWRSKGKIFKVEFLLPLLGKGKPWGKIEDGLEGERLRYLDLLVENVWRVQLKKEISVRIPHPGRFFLQKLLVYDKRKFSEKEKDCAYMVDLINLFFDERQIILKEIEKIAGQSRNIPERKNWVSRAVSKYTKLFRDENSEGVECALKLLDNLSRNQIIAQANVIKGELKKLAMKV